MLNASNSLWASLESWLTTCFQQFDYHILRAEHEGYLDPGADFRYLSGELHAIGL